MADENLLKELICWKLKMADHIIEHLPPQIKDQAEQNLHKVALACHEAMEEFLAREKREEIHNDITRIPVD